MTQGKTLSNTTEKTTTTLFPSMLPWLKPPGKSRRGPKPEQRREAFEWLHLVWYLCNFLEAGSPCRAHAAQSTIRRASLGEWTALHESYAKTIYNKILRYVAQPRGAMDRGSAKLEI